MAQYRKKPVVIEAVQNKAGAESPDWLDGARAARLIRPLPDGSVAIDTLEGTMIAAIDDWIIRGVKGEVYPCKPDVFAMTYEPVTS